jgi:hypothetical protein
MPWSSTFWEHNYFVMAWPPLRTLLSNDFVRGAVSGLGVVNLFAGFADLASLFGVRRPERLEPAEGRDPHEVSLHDDTR